MNITKGSSLVQCCDIGQWPVFIQLTILVTATASADR